MLCFQFYPANSQKASVTSGRLNNADCNPITKQNPKREQHLINQFVKRHVNVYRNCFKQFICSDKAFGDFSRMYLIIFF